MIITRGCVKGQSEVGGGLNDHISFFRLNPKERHFMRMRRKAEAGPLKPWRIDAKHTFWRKRNEPTSHLAFLFHHVATSKGGADRAHLPS